MNQKIYIGSGKEIQFKNGDKTMKYWLSSDDIEKLRQNIVNGGVNLKECKRKTPSPKGSTHYLVIDDWQPTKTSQTPQTYSKPQTNYDPAIPIPPADYHDSLSDDVPF